MKQTFTKYPSNYVKASDISSEQPVKAADDKKADIMDVVEGNLDQLEDDFDYAIAGIDKLCRDGDCQKALEFIDLISSAVNDVIAQIGDNIGDNISELPEE